MIFRDYQTQAVADLRAALIIYKATNRLNGKVYIGQTVQALAERMGDHRRKALVHSSKSHFHAAIRKYGFDAFDWTVLEKAEDRALLNSLEQFWIKSHESTNPSKGYNNTHGGDSFEFTEETKRRIGEAGRGNKRSEAFKENLRQIEKGDHNPFYGKHHTEEAKRKNREAHVGKKLKPEHIAKCIHLGSNNPRAVINEETARKIKTLTFDGWRQCDIVRELGISKTIVSGICRGITWRHV